MKKTFILPIIFFLTTLSSSCKSSQNRLENQNVPFETSLMELPKIDVGTQGEFLAYCGFNLSFNTERLIPNWVAYELTREETQGTLSRKKRQFQADPNIEHCATNADYSHSGYSRGHMAPAGDMKWDKCAMNSCFYLTNICPQDRSMNAGCWQVLEDKCRIWARGKEGSILIVCGPIVKNTNNTIGKFNAVTVPDGFFKAVLQKRGEKYVGAGFVFPNEEWHLPLEYYAVSIDEVERITGFDLFHNLPDNIEEKIESEFKYEDWGLKKPEKNILEDRRFLK